MEQFILLIQFYSFLGLIQYQILKFEEKHTQEDGLDPEEHVVGYLWVLFWALLL